MLFQRLRYFARETGTSIIRNLGMTFAVILTVVVTLVLVGGTLLLNQGLQKGESDFAGSQAIEIFMVVKANDAQIKEVEDALAADDRVKQVEFVSKDQALERFAEYFGEKQPAVVETATAEILPASFVVTPKDARQASALVATYQTRPGVEDVVSQDEVLRATFSLFKTFRQIFQWSAGLLLISSIALIVIAIRLAMVARRREIEVMKLVGASNLFIRIPFILEGIFQGLIGAAIAVPSVLFLLRDRLNATVEGSQGVFQAVELADAIPSAIWLVVAAIAVGVIGSVIGMLRFLDV